MILRVGVVICVASIVVALSHPSIARPGDQNQNKPSAAATGSAVVGIASTYNPFRPGYRRGQGNASGELYDPTAWTAAIQTNLRERFGGVRYGKNYRPTYALVSSEDKQVIVKVNDVGPLEPGRVIDLNEQTMRYFDPGMT
jgi:rare lipoprotein A